ncbi:iron-regulated protein A precursor [Vibrio ishigakensis]|uniref:Iron-regulated protein A n=1 Tax=Vibrio ishigakensis TaxID=1481914 RepID=A0A0B8P1V9_9VIBR|nr:iron-regulated protein A precursor [Vibrio ishigakensis]
MFRFGNPVVDDWEGQLNAWPLDEGLIDYVAADYQHELGNEGAVANIVANTEIQSG